MQIYSHNIKNGYLADQFGHRGQQFLKDKKPSRSFHVGWRDLPAQTQSIALIFIDHDAIPVCGFTWIHWTVANINPHSTHELPENASVEQDLLEGVTSWGSEIISEQWKLSHDDATGYGGCAPPDKEHKYTLQAYALDVMLNLKRGFYMNELINAMEDHILNTATLHFFYKAL